MSKLVLQVEPWIPDHSELSGGGAFASRILLDAVPPLHSPWPAANDGLSDGGSGGQDWIGSG
jgi:hypothetical protein